MFRIISSVFLPICLLVAAFFTAPKAAGLPETQLFIIKLLPVAIGIPMMLLCLRFNRSRLFFSSLAIVGMYVMLVWVLPRQTLTEERLLVQLLCLLIPFSLLIFSSLNERGVFTMWGTTRFMVFLVPLIIGWALIRYQTDLMESFFGYRFMPRDLTNWTIFSQLAQAVALLAFIIMNGMLFSRPDAQRGALFGGLIGLFVVLHYPDNQYISSVFTTSILLMFFIVLIQESWSMAYLDHLTGLPGRRALNDKMLKLSGTYSIAMMDIDHFKKFNDTYGHDAGDEVLRMVASRVRQVGSGGKVFRYGGEEFSIVFNGKQVTDVLDSLEEIRELVATSGFKPQRKDRREKITAEKSAKRKEVSVTISIGVAEHNEKNPLADDVIKAADKALYQAKNNGRNQVCTD